MPGILFVRGGDDHARATMRAESRAYWSAALPVVLEKHGYLATREAGPEALADPRTYHEYDAVLVARLPDADIPPGVGELAAAGRAMVLAEGPSPVIEEALHVRRDEPLPPFGELSVTDDRLAACAGHLGIGPGGTLTETRSRPLQRQPQLEWRALDPAPVSEAQASAWGATAWDVVRWGLEGDVRTLATWRPREGGPASPAIVQRGRLIGCCFGLFAFLSQRHTSEPFGGPEHRANDRTAGLEATLLALLDMMHREARAVRFRVMPWPAGTRWALSVRHDVDRALGLPRAVVALRRHERARTSATWYWRARHAPSRALSRVAAAPRQEIALHTDRLWADRGDQERRRVESAVPRAIQGSSAHGSADAFRFQGAPNVLWAERQRLLYTELIQQAHFHPHRFPALREDGSIRVLDLICLPHHESFELVWRGPGHETDRLLHAWPEWAERGGLLQVMNHPDRNPRRLFRLLRSIPTEGRFDCTAAEAAGWWRRTHVLGELRVEPRGDGSVALSSNAPVSGLVLEHLDPSGWRSERSADLD